MKHPITTLLSPREVQSLSNAELNPEDFTRLVFTANVQVSEPQPDGTRILRLHTTLPAGIVKDNSVIVLGPQGESQNILSGKVPVPPTVRILLRKDGVQPTFLQFQESQEVPAEASLQSDYARFVYGDALEDIPEESEE